MSEPSDPEKAVALQNTDVNRHHAIEDDLVTFKNPVDFARSKKWMITISAACATLTCTFASSIFSPAVAVTADEFHVSQTVTMLGVSLYVLGFGCGPVIWGPMAEYYDRRLPFLTGFSLFALMQIPLAITPSITGLLICRFLAGCFGASPLTVSSAIYADFWDPAERGIAMCLYSVAAFAGPTCGPIVGVFITKSKLGWRWTAWITLIMAGIVMPLVYFFVPETYSPTLKERAMKRRTAEAGYNLKLTASNTSTKQASLAFARKFLLKPAAMLVHEPILAITTLYISIAYGLIYLSFFAVPYAFDSERGWDVRIGSLGFIPMLVGVVAGNFFALMYTTHYYLPRLKKRGYYSPDDRVPLIMVGAFVLPIGLFWFAWTSSHSVSWVTQMISISFIGAGIMLVFSSCTAFLVDVYLTNVASALAASTSIRSFVAAGLPLAGPRMYSQLGTAWATSLLGFICVALIPAPFVFYKYSAALRAKSRYAYVPSVST